MILATHGIIGSQITQFVGLLDLYPSAAAAYSLRKLRAAYTGSAIRVRRASDNTEQNIGFVNNVLDTSSLTSFCSGTNGFVTTWYDQSGNGRNATQTTAANQPQIVSGGSVLLYNGKPTLKFDGINDSMNNLISFGANLSVYYVTERIAAPAAGGYQNDLGIGSSNGTDRGGIHYINPSLKGASFAFYSTYSWYDGDGTYGATNYKYLINFELTSSVGMSIYQNNALEKALTTSGTMPTDAQGLYIANDPKYNRFGNMNWCELIMWNTNQATNRSAINTNMNSFYSIY
jgi:hypothetical protein